MNEYHIPIVCGQWANGVGLVFMYKFMHVCKNVCISLYMYVGVHACMCVRLANDFINVKNGNKIVHFCEEISIFYR